MMKIVRSAQWDKDKEKILWSLKKNKKAVKQTSL